MFYEISALLADEPEGHPKCYKGVIKFRHPNNRAFYEYWCKLPKTGILPDRNSFMPEEIPSLLSTMVVYELVSQDFIRIRLIGSTVEERFGGHRTGSNYLDFVEEHRKDAASAAFWSQAKNNCGMHAVLAQELVSGRIAHIEVVGVPVSNVEGEHPILFFQSNEIAYDSDERQVKEPLEFDDKGDGLLKYIRVVERSYFDLGLGVPQFRD